MTCFTCGLTSSTAHEWPLKLQRTLFRKCGPYLLTAYFSPSDLHHLRNQAQLRAAPHSFHTGFGSRQGPARGADEVDERTLFVI